MMEVLATLAVMPAAGTLNFWVFWTWFRFWRRRPALTLTLMLATFFGLGVVTFVLREVVLAERLAMPVLVQVAGWLVIAIAMVFGTIADRQIGLRVRSFMPFFEAEGRLALVTTGAYGVVRHPIYASGIWFQLGAFLATGYLAVLASCAVFTLGAIWFTRQEERRLVALLDDPTAYERYRARVPALFPRLWR